MELADGTLEPGQPRRAGAGPKGMRELNLLRAKFLALEFVDQRCPSQAERFAVDHEDTFRWGPGAARVRL